MNDLLNGAKKHASSETSANAPPLDVGEALATAKAKLDAVDTTVRDFVSERPVTALVAAVACGFVIGRLLSR